MDAELVDALRAEYHSISAALAGASERVYRRSTPCAGWRIKELLFHQSQDAKRAIQDAGAPAPAEPPDRDFVTYWQAYDPAAPERPSYEVATRDAAAAYPTGTALFADWCDLVERALDVLASRPAGSTVATQGYVLTIEDFVRTLIVEATIHGLDLAIALSRPPWPGAGLDVTRKTMLGLLREPLPDAVEWSDVDLALRGAGREPLTQHDRDVLGPIAARFPLLG
jgi:uncharacterized protein (TIGR03083 family)